MINSKYTIRLLFDIFILILFVFSPWWLPTIFIIFGLIFFKDYYESLFFGLWIDSVYFNGIFGTIPFLFSILFGIMLMVSPYMRSRFNF